MTFLSPLFLLGAATAAIPIVLHFLHREPEARVKFAAVHLLRHAPVEDTRKRRLREWLLLALRVSALLLLALAFARPFVVSGAASTVSGVTIVALDTSLSMSAQFAHARQLAKTAIANAPSGELVGVVTFDDRARNASMPSTDRALALAAVDAAAPGFGATRYAAAIGAAAQTIASVQSRNATIVVVSDLQASGWDASDHAGVSDATRVQVVDVGPPPDNLAVTAARAQLDHVVATIRNAGKTARDAHVQLAVDGRHVSDGVVSVAAGASADVALAGANGTTAQVSVDDAAGISGDNTRYLVLDNTGQPTVLIVTTSGDLGRDAFYAQQAALASGTQPGFRVVGAAGADMAAWAPDRLAGVTDVMLTSTNGLDARGRLLLSNYVHAGGGMFVAAGQDVAGDVVAEILGGVATIEQGSASQAPGDRVRRFAPSDLRHPVFQAFENGAANLGLVAFNRVASISGKSCAALANFTTGEAALLDCPVGEGRALVLASDIDNRWNDFPRRPTFVPFVQESLRYLAGSRERTSEFLVGNAPAGAESKPGVVTLPVSGPAGSRPRPVAVNVDPREADSDRVSPDEFQAAVTRLKAAGRQDARLADSQLENRQHLWVYALLASLAFLAAESAVSMRAA